MAKKNQPPKPSLPPAKKTHQPQDDAIILMPIYPNPQKPTKKNSSSKCLVYFLALFVFLCFALLVFATILVRIKPPTLSINSVSIKSLKYDYSPSFNLTLLMNISISNNNFGTLEFHDDQKNNTLHLFYGNISSLVGDSKLKFQRGRVSARGEEKVGIEMKASSSFNGVVGSEESTKLSSDLNSGVLELVGFSSFKAEVYVLKKIKRYTDVMMKCNIRIDLKRQAVQKLEC